MTTTTVKTIDSVAEPFSSTTFTPSTSSLSRTVESSGIPPNARGRFSRKKIVLGICALDKKTKSKAMQALLSRIPDGDFVIEIYGNRRLDHVPVKEWPLCDVLICKRSSDMDMGKVLEFIAMHRPLLINDVFTQSNCLADRRKVYATLTECGIPVPDYVVMDRDGPESEWPDLEEFEDYIIIDGIRMDKPFVEKPVSGDDHNIYIYYPSSSGGGSKRMFRKRKNKSSQFYPDVSTIRKRGSFIYEHFMHTNGSDIKVYTVGPTYAHAEARKAPTLDGIVVRDENGKERRYPVRLSSTEKMYARRIVHAFKQNVCGFDILRTDHVSYVCDVNGWSLVKNSPKYWSDCAHIITEIILKTLDPTRLFSHVHPRDHSSQRRSLSDGGESISTHPTALQLMQSRNQRSNSSKQTLPSDATKSSNTFSTDSPVGPRRDAESRRRAELRCVVAVFRHGDRTPKQKMKMKTSHPSILALFHKYCTKKYAKGSSYSIDRRSRSRGATCTTSSSEESHVSIFENEVLLRTARELQDVLDMTRALLKNVRIGEDESDGSESELPIAKLTQLKTVLEMYGGFKGINRKVQLKPKKWHANKSDGATEILFVLKWGGALTKAGQDQAGHIGKTFRRTMYPTNDVLGLGLLRLHSTFRHDLKIYSSDEGRCLMTAAAFAKDFLDLEGELTPILTSLVRPAPNMLNKIPESAKDSLSDIKMRLHKRLSTSQKVDADFVETTVPTKDSELVNSVRSISPNPRAKLHHLWELVSSLTEQLRTLLRDQDKGMSDTSVRTMRIKETLYENETLILMYSRWKKLHRDLYHKRKDRFDMSKVPDVYDTAVYDMLHNRHFFIQHRKLCSTLDELYGIVKSFASIVIPQEYGMTKEEKLFVASSIGDNLLHKIHADLETASEIESDGSKDGSNVDTRLDAEFIEISENVPFIKTPRRHIRSRIYFTSESHLHSLVNVLKHATGQTHKEPLIPTSKFDRIGAHMVHKYCSHVVLRLWELPRYPPGDPRRWRVDLCYGPGAMTPKPGLSARTSPKNLRLPTEAKPRSASPVQEYGGDIHPLRFLNESLTLEHVQEIFGRCGKRGAAINKRMVRSSESKGSRLGLAEWGGRMSRPTS